MAKFSFKTFGKEAGKEGINILAITAGTLVTAKFLNFEDLMPAAPKDAFYIKHQGGIKAVGAFVILSMFPKIPTWGKMLIMGVAIEGAIREVRVLTGGEEKTMFSKIGADETATDEAIDEAANVITQQYAPAVAGGEAYENMQDNSQSAVAGMGADGKLYFSQRN